MDSVVSSIVDTVTAIVRDCNGEELDRQLQDFGLVDALDADLPATLDALFDAIGRERRTSISYDVVALHALGIPVAGHRVLHPLDWFDTDSLSERIGETIEVRGRVIASLGAECLVVPVRIGGDIEVRILPAVVGTTGSRPCGIDATVSINEVRIRVGVCETDVVGAAWTSSAQRTILASSSELLGLARGALDRTLGFVGDRHQFGRPIGSFQAVQHLLADAHVAVEGAAASLDAALAGPTDLDVVAAAALARTAAVLTTENCMQVSGAIGHSWEYDLHRIYRRVLAIIGLTGESAIDLRGPLAELLRLRRSATLVASRVG